MTNEAEAPEVEPTYSGAEPTPPTGQGGKSPKTRPDYQDQYPPNPPASDIAQAYGAKVDEMGQVAAAADDS